MQNNFLIEVVTILGSAISDESRVPVVNFATKDTSSMKYVVS